MMGNLVQTAAIANKDGDSAARRAGTITVCVVSSFEDVANLEAEWDEAVIRMRGAVYMSFAWAKTWWEFYGRNRTLRIYLLRSQGQLVGILPLYIDQLGFWPLHVRVARLVGANIPPKVFDPPVENGKGADCLRLVVRDLIENQLVDVLSLGPFSSQHAALRGLNPSEVVDAPSAVARLEQHDVHTTFCLPGTLEAYLDQLSKSEQKHRRKYELRMLRKAHSVRVEMLPNDPATLGIGFEEFVNQHTAQWREEGLPGHFGAWPEALAYNRQLVNRLGERGRVRLMRIWADNQIVAQQYTFAMGDRWYWELPSRIAGEEWSRYSLGPSAIITMLGAGIEEGVQLVEGGLSHYDYKLRLGAKEHETMVLRVTFGGVGAWLRRAIWKAWKIMIGVIYEKIWYRRILPRICPTKRGPRCWGWLRHDY